MKAPKSWDEQIRKLEEDWKTNARWSGVVRPYSARDVLKLRGNVKIEHTIASLGAHRLWDMLHTEAHVKALGALTGNQAVQMVKAGLKAIYLSGWQVAADANLAGETYPDQSLYPCNSVPALIRRINHAFQRQDQISSMDGQAPPNGTWYAPIVADGEAGFGGALNVYELTKAMIEAGTAAVHFEDQLAAEKKCGHMGGKVLIPTGQAIRNLISARLAADVEGTTTLIVARTDANGAHLITSDVDPRDKPFLTGDRTPEGFFRMKGGLNAAISRALAYAPYADLIWCETSEPNLQEAREFAEALHKKFPGKMMAYNCSPSFNWKKKLQPHEIAAFQDELGRMGYKFQFVTLAGFHSLNYSMFDLAHKYTTQGMMAYSALQEQEFASEIRGYTATKHQKEVGTGYFDEVAQVIAGGHSSTTALKGSTEEEQFYSSHHKQGEAKAKL